jgi:hypothetical protein
LVDQVKREVVLIVDEVQQTITTDEGSHLLMTDIELAKIEQLGGLATAIFERIASTDSDATGIFSADAAAEYSRHIGHGVKVDYIQPIVNELMAANIILRRGHGQYSIADPAVQEIWREKRRSLTFKLNI